MSNNQTCPITAVDALTLRLQLSLLMTRARGTSAELYRECHALREALGGKPTVEQVTRARELVGR